MHRSKDVKLVDFHVAADLDGPIQALLENAVAHIAERTAGFHLDNARAKLGVSSLRQAIVLLTESKSRKSEICEARQFEHSGDLSHALLSCVSMRAFGQSFSKPLKNPIHL